MQLECVVAVHFKTKKKFFKGKKRRKTLETRLILSLIKRDTIGTAFCSDGANVSGKEDFRAVKRLLSLSEIIPENPFPYDASSVTVVLDALKGAPSFNEDFLKILFDITNIRVEK